MTSPFSQDRYEYDAEHLYYLPAKYFALLETPKPIYLIGARGSGKTTLLKALNWQERLDNKSLLKQLKGEAFCNKYLGCYLKLPTIQLNSFESWLAEKDDNSYGLIFGFYFDLVFLELLSDALSHLLAGGYVQISPERESIHCTEWIETRPELFAKSGKHVSPSMSSMHQRIRGVRRDIETAARINSDVREVLQRFPIEQIGTLGTAVAKQMAKLLNEDPTAANTQGWHFKLCMDEGEALSRFQQRVMNTFVRLAEWPLFPIVSYVGRPDDISTTLIANLTLQSADRQLIVIDDMERTDFLDLAEGVATIRCQKQLDDDSVSFDAERVLGKLSINGLLQRQIARSEGQVGADLISSAQEFTKTSPVGSSDTTGSPPIYQAYLAKQLELSTDETTTRPDARYQESTQYRKKMVAAYLSICRLLRLKHVPYASADMVVGISDNCVRDFLSQLHRLFEKSGLELREFLTSEIKWDVQADAIREASDEKSDSIPESGVLAPVETGRLVKGLAIITATIQSSSPDMRHLRSTERGLFRLTGTEGKEDLAESALVLVREAADAGFLRLYKQGDDIRCFRVHSSLAPAYGFSYRGAYYEVRIDLDELKSLQEAETLDSLRRAAQTIIGRIEKQPESEIKPTGDEPPLPLFPNEDDEP